MCPLCHFLCSSCHSPARSITNTDTQRSLCAPVCVSPIRPTILVCAFQSENCELTTASKAEPGLSLRCELSVCALLAPLAARRTPASSIHPNLDCRYRPNNSSARSEPTSEIAKFDFCDGGHKLVLVGIVRCCARFSWTCASHNEFGSHFFSPASEESLKAFLSPLLEGKPSN